MITQILAKVLPVLVMIILGRVCATKGILNGEQHAGLKNVIGDILLPVVLFQAFFTADYGKRMLLVFVLVFVGYGAALAAGYALRRFVKPYGRFMPLLMTNAEGGMLGYALYALLCGADVIFLDEPFKGLDEATKALVVAETKRLCAGKTVLLVTHEEKEAAMMGAEQVVRMEMDVKNTSV